MEAPEESPQVGKRRDGRTCVAAFMPPDAYARYEVWRPANSERYCPVEDWEVGVGRAAGGKDFVAVWVPDQHVPAAD
jgi:hypothetical protein